MQTNEASSEALNYHKKQAYLANLTLLAFFLIMVVFTLYRVIAEWNLAQQYLSEAEYKKNQESIEKYKQDAERLKQEKNFILGRNRDGSPIAYNKIPRIKSTVFDSSNNDEQKEMISLHAKYSPFYKDCRFNYDNDAKKARFSISQPDYFVSSAMAILAGKVIDNNSENDALAIFCQRDALRDFTIIPDDGMGALNEFMKMNIKLENIDTLTSNNIEKCRLMESAAVKLAEIAKYDWFPRFTYNDNYLKDCTFTAEYNNDADVVKELMNSLSKELAKKLELDAQRATITEGEYKELKGIALTKLAEYKKDGKHEDEMNTLKDINEKIKINQAEIENKQKQKMYSESDKANLDERNLYQLLLSALFVLSALTAALTSAYLSRSHSFEIVEIERYQRKIPGYLPSSFNPFSKMPKQPLDLEEFINALKNLLKKDSDSK